MTNRPLLAAVAALLLVPPALAAEHPVSSAADIAHLADSLKPGDVVVLKDGDWTDQLITLKASGAEGNPITLRAQTPGKVILTGKSGVTLAGDHLVLSGLYLKNVERAGDAIAVPGNHCRVTDCAVVGGGTKFFVHLIGVENRMDHCYLAEKTTADPTFQIEVHKDAPNNDRVDHNHFGHRPPLGKNGGETIRVGYSGQSQWNSRAVVEENLFDRCDGEIEIISSKSCENVYRHNTFLDCAGFLTLRHGHRNTVDSNIFIAHHVKGSGGVRVINEGQIITNNYIEGVDKGAFWITAGIQDGPLTGYTRSKDCRIERNTILDFAGPGVELAAGLGTSNRTLVPEDVTIARNVFAPGEKGELIKGNEGKYAWDGNVAIGADAENFTRADGKLVRGDDGLLHVEPPVQGAGWDGKSRPLGPKDVGPSWMDPAERGK